MIFEDLLKGKTIALYGLGVETEKVIAQWKEKYHIIGLLDSFQKSGELYGYPILNLDEIIQNNNLAIVVVARPGSCKAIAAGIGKLCEENQVMLYDIRGKDLLAKKKVIYEYQESLYTREQLFTAISEVEAVSFDLFDTLVMRKIANPQDVCELVEAKLAKQGITILNLAQKRLQAEKSCFFGRAPRLVEIYRVVLDQIQDCPISPEELVDLEFQTELTLLVPRRDMVEVLKKAKSMGKRILLTSDTYYSKKQIEQILCMNQISVADIDACILSCEHDTGKGAHLFDKLIEQAGTKSILHIGDDMIADEEAARRNGLFAFRILSGMELFELVGELGLSEHIHTLSDKLRLGIFIATLFNSPFPFESKEKKIKISSEEELGYLLFAPMLFDFTLWFGQMEEMLKLENIWFGARDGFLMQKLYKTIYPMRKSDYFLTSRIAAIRAGVQEIDDVRYVDGMKFSGTIEDLLRVRFGMEASGEIASKPRNTLIDYSEEILLTSEEKRKNYCRYIESLELKAGSIGWFDFVAKGTTQYFLKKLVPNQMTGLYFLQLEPEYMNNAGISIIPFYTEEEREQSSIFENYYILETIVTSLDPSVDEFDENGKPCYAKETRSKENLVCVERVQKGICSFARELISLCPSQSLTINKKLDEAMLNLIHYLDIQATSFNKLIVEDPFFNRMTNISTVIDN